ncbi:MAG: aminoglycoside 6-adenylyltransferase [Lachnospiraceae bacterium]|nr:aminoglycoside 6-adenylyltransferase [Lachnospiraceae bacterium]
MRTEKEMMELILRTAEEDSRIRAVYMNGSRTNPNAPKDIFQDYDIVYVVEETGSFIRDREWIRRFGDILFMQYPDEHPDYPSDKENSYGWLMIFTDGNRLDLTVKSIPHAKENVLEDSLCRILLDKDGILPAIPEASEETYFVHRPSKEQYAAVCNEFWWCLNNIAKGLWRKEVTYAQDMLNCVVRKQLETMLSWKIGEMTGYSVSVGKSGKYMKNWLSEEEWQRYLDTYCGTGVNDMWSSVETMCRLFIDVSEWVAKQGHFVFDRQEADQSFKYFNAVKEMDEKTGSSLEII